MPLNSLPDVVILKQTAGNVGRKGDKICMEKKKKLPIGIEFFKDFKRDGFYYVDKTAFIRDFIDLRGSVNLFTRPRRFGKSLNMNMLKTFFESCFRVYFLLL